jgi:hypothetical protein
MTRTRMALTVTALGLAGLLSLTACGAATPAPVAAELADDAYALTAVGFEAEEPAPSASAAKDQPGRRDPARKLLRRNTLHGEVTVRTKQGVKIVVVQRGTVTAVDGSTVSVASTDGFTATWTFGDPLTVRKDRKAAERSAVVVGAEVGVAGARVGTATTARLIAVR